VNAKDKRIDETSAKTTLPKNTKAIKESGEPKQGRKHGY